MRSVVFLLSAVTLSLGIASLAGAGSKLIGPPLPSGTGAPVVVELFTSQGCSSCPPADALLARLATDPNIIAITRPVTYWDNLGWKDSLAREDNTQLQRAYAARGGDGSGVYTPQAMVQGNAGVVGSDERRLRSLIASARATAGPVVTLSQTQGGAPVVSLSGRTTRSATLTVIALRSSVAVKIGHGENGGRTVHYSNVLVGEQIIGSWSGGLGQFTIPEGALHSAGADRAAVLVRQSRSGPIIAARFL